MSARPLKQRILIGALALTIALSAFSATQWQTEDEPAAAPVSRPRVASGRPVQPQPRLELERMQRQNAPAPGTAATRSTFRAMSWYVPPPPPPPKPPPKPMPPPPPTAPPMPFSFLGRYVEEGVLTILLVKGDRIYPVSEGEMIENTYRVERLNGGQLELTYLPLNIKQTISAGGT